MRKENIKRKQKLYKRIRKKKNDKRKKKREEEKKRYYLFEFYKRIMKISEKSIFIKEKNLREIKRKITGKESSFP